MERGKKGERGAWPCGREGRKIYEVMRNKEKRGRVGEKKREGR